MSLAGLFAGWSRGNPSLLPQLQPTAIPTTSVHSARVSQQVERWQMNISCSNVNPARLPWHGWGLGDWSWGALEEKKRNPSRTSGPESSPGLYCNQLGDQETPSVPDRCATLQFYIQAYLTTTTLNARLAQSVEHDALWGAGVGLQPQPASNKAPIIPPPPLRRRPVPNLQLPYPGDRRPPNAPLPGTWRHPILAPNPAPQTPMHETHPQHHPRWYRCLPYQEALQECQS